MFPLGNFHDGLYSHEKTYFRGAELPRNAKLLQNPFMKVNSHEISQKTALKTPMQTWQQHYFHEGGRHGELS